MASPTGSAPTAAPSLPPGYVPPATIVTDDDHSGYITITAALCLTCVLLSLGLRWLVRHGMGRITIDDGLAIGATAVSIIESALVFVQVADGNGKSIDQVTPSALDQIQKIGFTNDIFYILILYLSKCSIAFLYIRLMSNDKGRQLPKAVLAVSTVWAVMSILMIALKCDLARPWDEFGEECPNLLVRWDIISAINIAIEVWLSLMSLLLVKDLQVALNRKLVIVAAFGLRLPVVAATLLRLFSIKNEIGSDDPTFDGVFAVIWTQVELAYSVIAITIPTLRPFMKQVSTNYGTINVNGTNAGSKYGVSVENSKDSSASKSYKLSGLSAPRKAVVAARAAVKSRLSDSPQYKHSTEVTAQERSDWHSLGSNDSRRIIVNTETSWSVEPHAHGGATPPPEVEDDTERVEKSRV